MQAMFGKVAVLSYYSDCIPKHTFFFNKITLVGDKNFCKRQPIFVGV